MKHPLKERIEIERVILGACLIENGYTKVADILNAKNFLVESIEDGLHFNHQKIFTVFETFYPTRPIDLFTVHYSLRSAYGYAYYLSDLSSSVSSTANIRYYALLLLEYNIRNAFLDSMQAASALTNNTAHKASIREIIDEALDYDLDIFNLINRAQSYLKTVVIDDDRLLSQVNTFVSQIDARIEKIKQISSVDCLLKNIEQLNGVPSDSITRMAVNHIGEVLKYLLSSNKISKELSDQILKLKTS